MSHTTFINFMCYLCISGKVAVDVLSLGQLYRSISRYYTEKINVKFPYVTYASCV